MQGPPSHPDAAPYRGGTIVGMPAVVPLDAEAEAARRQELSTTLRSRIDPTELTGPCSDPFHPERWSKPPPTGARPIYPVDDPEEEEGARVLDSVPPPGPPSEPPALSADETWPSIPPSFIPKAPMATRPEPATSISTEPPMPEEPVILPMRSRGGEAERRLLMLAAGVAALFLVTTLTLVLALT